MAGRPRVAGVQLAATDAAGRDAGILAATAGGHSLHGVGRLLVDTGMLTPPATFCLLNTVRTADERLPVSILTGLAAVLVGTLLEIVAAYAGLIVAFVGYVMITSPNTAATVVNDAVTARVAAAGLRRTWRALA